MLRGLVAFTAIGVLTLSLLPFQLIAVRLGLGARRRIPVAFHRAVCACLGVRIRQVGGRHMTTRCSSSPITCPGSTSR